MPSERRKKRKNPIWFLLLLAGITIYSVMTMYNQQLVLDDLEKNRVVIQERLDQAKQENEDLLKEKEDLQKPEYLERIARDDLGMTRQGEMPYIYKKKQ